MFVLINLVLGISGAWVIYNLALALTGNHYSFKKTWFPALIYGVLIYIYKTFFFDGAPALHTIAITVTCVLLMYFFNRLPIYLSVIGSLVTFIIITFASNLIMCPIAMQFGMDLSSTVRNDMGWILLNLMELSPAVVVLIVLRVKNLSITKFFNMIQG